MKKITILNLLCLSILFWSVNIIAQQSSLQVENMNFGGPYASPVNSPFNGGAFFGNGDQATANLSLPNNPGLYNVTLNGASSSNSDAKIDLFVAGTKVGVFTFNGTASSSDTKEITINSSSTNPVIKLELSTDSGNNDTFVDKITFSYIGAPPPPLAAPVIPSQSAFESGTYRNMFVEAGKSPTAVQNKLNDMWNKFFVNGSTSNERLLYNVGSDMAYILDTGNNDIRSEGQSYGMMICVQLDKKTQFDKLWKWAQKYSQHRPGNPRQGLFAWEINTNSGFTKEDSNSAPDGEEYFVTALFFADALWGSQTHSSGTFNPDRDIFDYKGQANYILDNMLNKPTADSGGCPTNLVDLNEKQIVFGICGNSATFTDPSYHLAAFYDIWAANADNNNQLWADMADVSTTYLLPRAAHPVTGLMPDYSTFDGTPTGSQQDFAYDAWRNIMNMGFDFNWFQKRGNALKPLIERQIDFFIGQGNGYGDRYNINGTQVGSDHSPGLVATNAVGALALEDAKAWPFVEEFFDTSIPSGQYRYYNGLLFMMSYMHLAGEFKVLTSNTVPNPPNPPTGCSVADSPSGSLSKTNETSSGANDGTITITFNDRSGRSAIEFSKDGGTTYPLNVADNSGTSTFSNLAPGNYNIWSRWGNDDCPVAIGSITVNAGTSSNMCSVAQSPSVSVSKTNETISGANNGSITLTFDDRSGRSRIEFSIDGGNTYPLNVTDNSGTASFNNLTPGSYDIWTRWGNNQCPIDLGSKTINAGTGGTSNGNCAVIEAESNTENYYQLNNNNGVIDNIGYSHWMKFENVDIIGGKFTYRYSKGNNQNGYMKVRIDNNNDANNLIQINPSNTGGWNNYQEETVNISGSGVHTVYLYFHDASTNIKLDWIKFGNNCNSSKQNKKTSLQNIDNDITIYPNPSSGEVNINFNDKQNRSITIYNIRGSIIYKQKLTSKNTLKLNNLSAGMHLVKINTDGVIHSKKLIIK